MKLRKLTLEEQPPVLLALSGILGIGPMAIYRLLEGNYAVAAINLLCVICFLCIVSFIYVKRAVRLPSAFMAVVAIATAVVSIRFKGGIQIVWLYPAVIALFYLLKAREAALTAVLAVALVTPVVLDGRQLGEVAVILLSLGVTICLSVAFATLTAAQRRELQAITLTDPLTGASNRRALDATLDQVIGQAHSGGQSFVLIMLDLDRFKSINDQHGHKVGDSVLCDVATTIKAHIRPGDACFRAGGEEFVVVAAMSKLEQGRALAERLRVAISELTYDATDDSPSLTVTASFGLAEYRAGETRDGLYKRSDDALYEAKRLGRNRLHASDSGVSASAA